MKDIFEYIKSLKPHKRALVCILALFVLCVMLANIFIALGLSGVSDKIIGSVFPSYVNIESDVAVAEDIDYSHISRNFTAHNISDVYREFQPVLTLNNIGAFHDYVLKRKLLYTIDDTAYVYPEDIDFEKLLGISTHVDFDSDKPKVLIFHTHSREAFCDSRNGNAEDSIFGVGDDLENILEKKYNIPVLHHKGSYDVVNGEEVRSGSYEIMEKDITKVLAENPSIEVCIDLHRDSLPDGMTLTTEIDGRDTAKIMFFNGICRLNDNGAPKDANGLVNPYLEQNLALSLKLKLLANEMYPDFTRKNYIKPYRYSLHMKPLSLLIEVGSDSNTVDEAKNAMIPLAELLNRLF